MTVVGVAPMRRMLRRLPLNDQPWLAIWRAEAVPAAPADLVCEFTSELSASEGDGTLIGEFAPNGAFCIATGGSEVV
jgi:hypothetical protein